MNNDYHRILNIICELISNVFQQKYINFKDSLVYLKNNTQLTLKNIVYDKE